MSWQHYKKSPCLGTNFLKLIGGDVFQPCNNTVTRCTPSTNRTSLQVHRRTAATCEYECVNLYNTGREKGAYISAILACTISSTYADAFYAQHTSNIKNKLMQSNHLSWNLYLLGQFVAFNLNPHTISMYMTVRHNHTNHVTTAPESEEKILIIMDYKYSTSVTNFTTPTPSARLPMTCNGPKNMLINHDE